MNYKKHSITAFKLALSWALVALMALSVHGQTIKHTDYTTYYDAKIGEPDSVSWVLTPAMVSCKSKLPRINVFIADPQIPNTKFNIYYQGSGFDQGHQFNADDASCNPIDE